MQQTYKYKDNSDLKTIPLDLLLIQLFEDYWRQKQSSTEAQVIINQEILK